MSMKIEENLTKDEKILITAEKDKIVLIVGAVITVICFIINVVLGLLWLIIFYRAWIISYCTTHLCLTNKRVYGVTGLIKRTELDMPLDKVNTITISKGLFGSILGYGNVSIKSFGDGWTFMRIKNAQEIKKLFYELQEK